VLFSKRLFEHRAFFFFFSHAMHPKKVKKSLFQHRVIHILLLMFSDCFLITVELKYHIFSCYQLEVKPNPHPERPDRLRAIAASLSAAGAYNRLPLLI